MPEKKSKHHHHRHPPPEDRWNTDHGNTDHEDGEGPVDLGQRMGDSSVAV
jgi:hypothetical protein